MQSKHFFSFRPISNTAFHRVTAKEYFLPRWKGLPNYTKSQSDLSLTLTTCFAPQVSYIISGQRVNAELIEYQILCCRAHTSGQVIFFLSSAFCLLHCVYLYPRVRPYPKTLVSRFMVVPVNESCSGFDCCSTRNGSPGTRTSCRASPWTAPSLWCTSHCPPAATRTQRYVRSTHSPVLGSTKKTAHPGPQLPTAHTRTHITYDSSEALNSISSNPTQL